MQCFGTCLTSSTSCPLLAALLLDYSTARCRARAAGERLCYTWLGDLLRCLPGEKVGSGRKAGACFLDNVAFFASWILKPAVSVLLISFDFPSARILVCDSYM